MNAKDVRDGSPKNKRKEIAFYFFYVCSAMLHMSDDSTWSDGQSGILSLVLVNKYKPEREREHGQKKDTGNLHNTHVFTNVTSSKHTYPHTTTIDTVPRGALSFRRVLSSHFGRPIDSS